MGRVLRERGRRWSRRERVRLVLRRVLRPSLLAALAAGALALAPGYASAASTTINGNPFTITAEDVSNIQARLAGSSANVFFPPDSFPGASGLFVGFPADTGTNPSGGPAIAGGTVYGTATVPAGPRPTPFTSGTQSAVSGSGTPTSPLSQVTTYKVTGADGKFTWPTYRQYLDARADTPDDAVFLPGRNVLLLSKAMLWCHLHGVEEVALAPLESNPFPDATPALSRDTAFIAAVDMGDIVSPMPRPMIMNPASRSA